MSFILQINGANYAGWTDKYGNGGGTLAGQGYGYAVLCETAGKPGWYSPDYAPGKLSTSQTGSSEWVSAWYTVTITDTGIEWGLDEVAFGVRAN